MMHLEYDFYIFENGCIYDCVYVKHFSDKLKIDTEVFMLWSSVSQQPYHPKGYSYTDDHDEDLVCVCFEKDIDALYYRSCMENSNLFVQKVRCITLSKMIEDSNYTIGVIIKKQTYHLMRYIEYMSTAILGYGGFH